jgi:type II secretory pathway component PulJ
MRLLLALIIYRIIALIIIAMVASKETPAIHKKMNQNNRLDRFAAISDNSLQASLFL